MQSVLGPLLHLLVGATFGWVGYRQWMRQREGDDRKATRFFVIWWAGLAVVEVGRATQGLMHAAFGPDIQAAMAIDYVNALAFSIGLWGLLTYVFYLFGAPDRIWIGTGTYYAIYGGLFLATLAWLDPVFVESTEFGVRVVFARDLSAAWFRAIFALFLIPPLMASLSILHLARQHDNPTVRRRALFVGLGVITWCASTWLSVAIATSATSFLHFLPIVLDGFAGMMIVWAYHFAGWTPPWRVQAPGLPGTPEPHAGDHDAGPHLPDR